MAAWATCENCGLHLVFLVDHTAPSGTVKILASVHAEGLQVFGQPGPDSVTGCAFLCIHLCALV